MTIAIAGFLIFSCNNKNEKTVSNIDQEVLENEKVDMHTSETSLDWAGTYKGILPCADCEGIETKLVLNQDLTYSLKTQYLGKDNIKDSLSGNFKWDTNGSIIQLEGIKEGDRSSYFKVEENRVRQLDMEGLEISGPLSDDYILIKQ